MLLERAVFLCLEKLRHTQWFLKAKEKGHGKQEEKAKFHGLKTVFSLDLFCANLGRLSFVFLQKILKNHSNMVIYDHLVLWGFRCTGAGSELIWKSRVLFCTVPYL